MSGGMPLLPIYAFMAWKETTTPFYPPFDTIQPEVLENVVNLVVNKIKT
jgi:hypothetical protein